MNPAPSSARYQPTACPRSPAHSRTTSVGVLGNGRVLILAAPGQLLVRITVQRFAQRPNRSRWRTTARVPRWAIINEKARCAASMLMGGPCTSPQSSPWRCPRAGAPAWLHAARPPRRPRCPALACWRARAYPAAHRRWTESATDAALRQIRLDLQQLTHTVRQPIRRGDYQGIALAQVVLAPLQRLARTDAGSLFAEHLLSASCSQVARLRCQTIRRVCGACAALARLSG